MKKIYTAILLVIAFVMPALAEDVLVFDVTSSEGFNQCSKSCLRFDRDYEVWSFSTYNGITLNHYNVYSYDDYLTTPDLDLKTGRIYVVKTTPSLYNTNDSGYKMKVLLGQGDDLTTYSEVSTIEGSEGRYSATAKEVTFMVPADGKYRVSFECTSKMYINNTTIMDRGESVVPMAPVDFTAVPDPDGNLKVDISFTMPSTTITGQPISGTTYNLYRGVQKIKSGVAAAPGEKVTHSETRGEAGNVTYAVEITAGNETSEKVSIVTYLGPETPEAPADVTFSLVDGESRLSWTAPVKGMHGAALDPSRLSYTVTRFVDDKSEVVASGITATEFAETVVPEGLQSLHYGVVAKYAAPALESAMAESKTLRIGVLAMPFTDSFADGVINPLWDNECVAHKSNTLYYWTGATTLGIPRLTEDYNGDSGFAYYNFYNIQAGNEARLSTPPLAFEDGSAPTLTFAKYNVKTNNRNDVVKIQVSCDNGEWIDVPGAEFTPQDTPAEEWVEKSVNLTDAIPAGTKSFRVGFLAISDYGQSFVIDDVKVFNLVNKDLGVSSINIAESVLAGNEVTVSVTLSNMGATDIAAGDYTVDVISDFPAEIDLGENVDIPSLGSATFTAVIPVNSIHALDIDSYSFAAEVKMDGDEVASNNLCEALKLAVGYSEGTPAADFKAAMEGDDTIVFSWTPAKDLDYVPVDITESFEDESYKDDFTGPFNGWTVIDLDGRDGGTWYSASGSVFNVATNVSTPTGRDGKNVLGVTVASNVKQDDWIISPAINCKDGRMMNIDFLLGLKQISSYGNEYKVEILYTTAESYEILNPQNSFTNVVGEKNFSSVSDREVPQDNKMHPVSFTGIPSDATYVAIHFCGKGSYTPAMWVDNIHLYEVDTNPLLGYRLYDVNAGYAINEELIDASAASYSLPVEASGAMMFSMTRPVFVSAVYADGEARPSNMLDLDAVTTGISDVAIDEAASAPSRWFNLQGIEVPADRLAPGVYIRRSGSTSTKVVVR